MSRSKDIEDFDLQHCMRGTLVCDINALASRAGGQQIVLAPNAWEGKVEAGTAAATLELPLQASPLDPTILAIPGPNPTGNKGIPLK